MLRKSPLENHPQVVGQALEKPPLKLFNGDPFVGFRTMVAPVSKTAKVWDPSSGSSPLPRHVLELYGRANASSSLAPSLHSFVWKVLESKKVSPTEIDLFLNQKSSLARYDRAFRVFYKFFEELGVSEGLKVEDLNVSQIAGHLLLFNSCSESQARNAYSGFGLAPGFDQLKFSPILSTCKRKWGSHSEKYGVFWSAENFLAKLQAEDLNWSSVCDVRDRLLIILRLLHAMRSVDLANLRRVTSSVGEQPYMLTRRKGKLNASWEPLVTGLGKALDPLKLMQRYVLLTSAFVPAGSPVFISLHPPYRPLTSNTLASLTRKLMEKAGIPTSVWAPHSTRGASVSLYKNLGLSSEQVCEIGQWKNFSAFQSHYLRLGAAKAASLSLQSLVHSASPVDQVEPDWSRTPKKNELGGSDQEGDTQETGEPTHPPREVAQGNTKTKQGKPLTFKFLPPTAVHSALTKPRSQKPKK